MNIRLNIVYIIILAIAFTLLSRVYFLSIKSNTYYDELSKNNYIKRMYKVPVRGIIEDRNGEPLALNKIGFSISIKPHLRSLKYQEKLESIVDVVVKHFPQYDKNKLLKEYKRNDSAYNHEFIEIIDFIPYEEFFPKYTILASNEDLKIEPSSKRFYPYNETAAHIIGYVGKASKLEILNNEIAVHSGIVGKNGLEKFYNSKLQGELGYKDVKVNALNQEIEVLEEKDASTNNNIEISIDIKLQRYLQELFDGKSGSIVVMDARNGEIIAAASFPEYDSNIFARGISQNEWNQMRNDFNHPFTNKIINGLYPPGSVIKMGVALSFLENGIPENFTVNCSGSLPIGNRNFRCWKTTGHGNINFRSAIAESCDDFFYKGSLKLGINKISHTLDKLGFGQLTGIDQINEFMGVNPNKEWKEKKFNKPWYVGETVITSIGQGNMLTTPLQIARYTAFIATGKLPKPHLYKANYEEPKELDIPEKHIDLMRKGMYDVSYGDRGTARRYITSKVPIASKTGTAQVVSIPQSEKVRMKESELEYFQRSHAWITTYGPFKNPKYVVTVVQEHGGGGGSATGGVASKIFDKLYELGYITQDEL
ncbi:penicillin-binding protein 2 [Aliarcobacter butzleri]|uniref:Penicillin-binding protein 2 n=3 Tax=Aliarcobacter butzleri TaxID=28197 RepID=A0AAW7PPT4_9BACT|nr:penicillin-binding protein 2 [Aliarcobacter butzleri]EFU69496.1 penicillin-binding protein 2 [Aliarcobacter butzleri JV22]KLE01273.1 penicillin-binding protein 2 [Aliarcobacter butzleri L348]KLE09214.1 penicillin-binding protein 2 [Aliarcobacter butzleri L355]MBF7065093.1 penicillin-binding protein 2 [Aliarcobacter butzleri]MCG3655203.1 penicillin-binding protein 2 [Aliarcobacter butzleri]